MIQTQVPKVLTSCVLFCNSKSSEVNISWHYYTSRNYFKHNHFMGKQQVFLYAVPRHSAFVTWVKCHTVKHVRYKSSKPLPVVFGQTEKTGFKVFGSFQPGLPRKVPQSLWKVITNGKANLGVHFPSFRHALEAIWGSFSASFAPKRGFQKPFSPYFLLLQIFKTPFRCKRTGKGFWRFVAL